MPASPSYSKALLRWPWMTEDRSARRLFVTTVLAPTALVLLLLVGLPATHALTPASEVQAPSPTLDALRVTEAFLSTRMELASQQQAVLAVDLIDSVLTLEIRGVPVRQVPLRDFRMSALFDAARRQGRLTETVGGVFTLTTADATIPRMPIRLIKAPRDTVEAQTQPPQEVPVETAETHCILRFDRGLVVYVSQPSSGMGAWAQTILHARVRLRTTMHALSGLARGKAPVHDAWIHLILAPEDARAVYRALPEDARLALRP